MDYVLPNVDRWQHWLNWSKRVPGALICHPVALLALAALIANDHALKQAAPGFLTGKISDVAGLIYFPVFLVAALELARPAWVERRQFTAALASFATVLAFVVVKTIPSGTDVFNDTLGFIQWAVGGGFVGGLSIVPTNALTDPTDLLALPAVLVAFGLAGGSVRVPSGTGRRVSPITISALLIAGLASVATSPAMRSSSTNYEETLSLTRDAPAVTRHITLEVTNRDGQLADLVLLARSYTKGTYKGMPSELDTEGVLVTLVPDDRSGEIAPSGQYMGPELSFFERCKKSCREGATVIVRLVDPELAAGGPIATNLEITLAAGASEEGTGPVDIDLALTNDAELAFQGAPVHVSAQTSGSVHVGADAIGSEFQFDIVIDQSLLQEPYGYPLIGEIAVWHDNKRAIGHDNAQSSGFEFSSPTGPDFSFEYNYVDVGTGWVDEAPPPPTTINMLPLCEPDTACRIHAVLTSVYNEYLNDPEQPGQSPVLGSIDFDWHVEVRIIAFDGRPLPAEAITFETVD